MRFESFDQMLKYLAGERPEAPALRYEGRTVTFSGLAELVRSRAGELRSSGKTCAAILAESTPECVIEIFAANLAGMQVVMLDPSLSDELLARLLPYSDADSVWSSDPEFAEDLAPHLSAGLSRDGAGGHCGTDRILFFTSGTTSSSKAVVLTGRSLCSSAWNGSAKLPLTTDDTLLCVLPLAHVFGFVCGLLWGLSCGACVALGTGPRGYVSDFGLYKPTAVSLVPLLLGFLLKNGAFNPELRTLLIGAGDCPAELIGAAKSKGISVSFGYGLTETSSGVAISTSGDPYAMEICPDDRIDIAEDGEILITAPTCMMQGYYKDPASTAEALSGGVLKSGDLGYIGEDGRLRITGRKKDVLALPDGTKIFLPEYEAALAGPLAGSEFAVDLRDGRPVLIFCGDSPKEEIIKIIRPVMDELPRGQQITDVIFTPGPLPRTATGKLKRWEIRQKVGL
ncbi:MAG: acyl--CoA ligase [Firmicutes bacterium]|nr:acyl--CoA ligase [Bacillota bacterium]